MRRGEGYMFVYIKNRFRRLDKIARGAIRTFGSSQQAYSSDWWDRRFYRSAALSDSQTISSSIDPYSTGYHYASIELILTKYFFDHKDSIDSREALDIGSGSGHWVGFYDRMGFRRITGIDVSAKAIEHLRGKYAGDDGKQFFHGTAREVLQREAMTPTLINAIGVMFHIVDDEEWQETLSAFSRCLPAGGVLVAGGEFGLLDGINVQFDVDGTVNKRLRSKARWTRTLKSIGFGGVEVIRNHEAFKIDRRLPESHILIATK